MQGLIWLLTIYFLFPKEEEPSAEELEAENRMYVWAMILMPIAAIIFVVIASHFHSA